MLASTASSKRTGSVQQVLTKFPKCVGNDHYMPVFLIAPNLNSEKKDIDNSRVIDSAKIYFSLFMYEHNCVSKAFIFLINSKSTCIVA